MSVKSQPTQGQKEVARIRTLASTSSDRDELLNEIDKLEKTIDRLTRKTKEERQKVVSAVMSQLQTMNSSEARAYIVENFNKDFFDNEFDVRFKEELAEAVYRFCKTELSWDYSFLKKQAYLL